MEEDLALAIMNLVSLEEHFFMTSQKTEKNSYLDLLTKTREIRKQLLSRLITSHEGETWCISKHLLAATMRLMEVGTKFQSTGKLQEAQDMFRKSYEIFSIFWALRLNLLQLDGVKSISPESLSSNLPKAKNSWQMSDIVSELVDCCKE
jgi:predicted GNAT family N-acyltransferase